MATGEKMRQEDVKRYLFAEMTDDEREAFDERMFADDGLFFDVSDAENRMVDQYVARTLDRDEAVRFERSLDAVPARREKVANARSLYEFIEENRPAGLPEPERVGFLDKVAGLFAVRTGAFGLAAAALVVLLMVSTGVLFVQNRKNESDLARLRGIEDRTTQLQTELENTRQHEGELQTAIDAERDASGDLQDELDRERSRREEIERELGKVKNTNTVQSGPVIASAMLFPIGGRGGNGGTAPDIKIGPETKRLSMRLTLPDNITTDDRLTVRLNQRVTARDIAPRIVGTKKSINVNVPTANLNKGHNDLDVLDSVGRSVSTYGFNVVEK